MGDLDAMIARIRKAGRMGKEAVHDAADAFGTELRGRLASGQGGDGSPWAPKKDGGQPLTGAAGHVTVRAVGASILARLTGWDVFHHYGTSRVPRRPILPTAGLPGNLGEAIKRGLVAWWDREVRK